MQGGRDEVARAGCSERSSGAMADLRAGDALAAGVDVDVDEVDEVDE